MAYNCVTKYQAKLGIALQQNAEAQKWLARNQWINDPQYAAQAQTALAIDRQLIGEGKDNKTAAYYDELDQRLREKGVIVPETPAAPATAAASPSSTPPTCENPSTSQGTTLEKIQAGTNFLLTAQIPGARIVAASETPAELAAHGTACNADQALGAVKICRASSGVTGLDLASQVINGDAQRCQGKFASFRKAELVDADVVFRAQTSCVESQGQTDAQYFIAPRPLGGFVAFSVITMSLPQREAMASEQKVDLFKKAALTAVGTRH